MRISGLFFSVFGFLLPPALICTICLYLFPALFACSFPDARPPEAACSIPGQEKHAVPAEIAPFRLLAFGDPQLEGDTSLPDPNAPWFPSLVDYRHGRSSGSLPALKSILGEDIPWILKGLRKRVDIWGNDLYLAHVYRLISWWTEPTHTVVLGDLLGSQWIGDDEYKRRSSRFWNTVFKGRAKVPQNITEARRRTEKLGEDGSWKHRIITVAGNHDIGYAGDIDEHRIERFEDAFGAVNWDIRFNLENDSSKTLSDAELTQLDKKPPELHLIVLNSMNLDSPALRPELQQESQNFLSNQLYGSAPTTDKRISTVLLTHIPFHKMQYLCIDGPHFNYFPQDQGGGIREQNHLSEISTDFILAGLKRTNKPGNAIVLNGHDHEGCDAYHYRAKPLNGSDTTELVRWYAKRTYDAIPEMANNNAIGVREITVRSMMGSYGGYAGLLSGWFDWDAQEWKFEFTTCMLGSQHIWWGVHVLDIIVVGSGLAGLLAAMYEAFVIKERGSGQEGKVKKA